MSADGDGGGPPPRTPGAGDGPRDPRRRALLVFAMCLAPMATMFNATMVNVMVPQIGSAFRVGSGSLEWVSAAYTLSYGALLLLGGGLGAAYGRRRAFLWGVALFALSSAACALAPGLGWLLAFRCLQGAGTALMLPQTLAVLTAEFADPAQRARVVGLWAGVSSLGLAAGPVLGGLLITVTDWRWGFGLSAVFGAAAVFMGARAITGEHGRPADPPRLDVVGAALGAVALGALVEGLLALPAHGWGAPRVWGALLVSAAALPGFLAWQFARQAAGRDALMPPRLWRHRGLAAANIAGVAYFFLFFGTLYFYPVDLQEARGHTAMVTGLLFLPMMLLTAVMGPVAGRLTARVGAGRVMLTGLLLGAAASGLLAALPAQHTAWALEWRMGLLGIAAGLMSSPMSNLAVSEVSTAQASTAAAVHNTFRQIGSTLGVAVLGVITAHAAAGAPAGYDPRASGLPGLGPAMATTAGLLAAACAGAALLLARRRGARESG